jgi:hypothetical protein
MWGMKLDKILVKVRAFMPLSIRIRMPYSAFEIKSNLVQERKMESLGAKIGLSKTEVHLSYSTPSPITGKPLPQPTSPFSKFCISTIFIGILIATIAFMLIISTYWEDGIEWSNPFYIPGTLYGTVKPLDFR